jgi:single-strand DNA-binding protein
MNHIVLIGRLVADPVLRYTQSGVAVTSFTLAVDRNRSKEDGQRETDFIDVVTWRKQAETCANNLTKGRLVAVSGRLQIRRYDDKDGIRRKAAEVVADRVQFLDWAKQDGAEQASDWGSGDDAPF